MTLRRAVSDTVKYAGFFNFPLTPEEIHHWLICSRPVPLGQIRRYLPDSLSEKEKRFRTKTTLTSNQKIEYARKLVKILRLMPGLRMVAITGSIAAGNSRSGDDIDLFFITSPHTLWLVRPFVLILISLFFRRRYPGEDHSTAKDAFCPNLWMDSLSISVPKNKRSLYTAHEVLQVIPLFDRGGSYHHFMYQNRWVKRYLANAYLKLAVPPLPKKPNPLFYLLAPFNFLFFVFQFLYMKPKKTSETVHLHAAYLHTTDFASQIRHHLSQDI